MMSLLLIPFLTCVVLVLVHVYFGAFVLRRGILFIDLALAQWAALGYVVGHGLDIENTFLLFGFGFAFTLLASVLLTFLKPIYNKGHLQEAVIGVVYIIASALSMGIISTTGMEGHHLKEMLAGHLLFIQVPELIFAYSLYAVVGLIIYFAHKKFLVMTTKKWDFIFYMLFGLVVTSSVKLVGILLVFSYLIIPLLAVVLFTKLFNIQVLYAWMIGIIASTGGLLVSMKLDIPPSYCIILMLSLIWMNSVVLYVLKNKNAT